MAPKRVVYRGLRLGRARKRLDEHEITFLRAVVQAVELTLLLGYRRALRIGREDSQHARFPAKASQRIAQSAC